MSTRSQIIIKDQYNEQWFYRHSDGYPEGNLPQLFKFMSWLKEGKIRNNVGQSSGWLILIGAEEYKEYQDNKPFTPKDWKVGAYELCPHRSMHGDIEWLYIIDLEENTISIQEIRSSEEYKFTYDELKRYKGKWEKIRDLFTEG